MKLTVNKEEAELLKDVSVNSKKKTVYTTLTENNVKITEISFKGLDKWGEETFKQVLVGIDEDGKIMIGYRNRYGNGYRVFPIEAFEKLLWEDSYKTDNLELLRENRESYTLA